MSENYCFFATAAHKNVCTYIENKIQCREASEEKQKKDEQGGKKRQQQQHIMMKVRRMNTKRY